MRKLFVAIGLIIIIGLLIFLNIPRKPETITPPNNSRYMDEIARLNEQIKGHEMTIEALQDSLLIMDSLIANNQNKIVYIKSKANEKANRVSSFTSKQLNEFLTERYKDSIR